ncbi:hypothetical protein QJS10_CPA10g01852 [Acorus calamus]|uniref:Viral late gene transcription factor 3 zinc ribbon domain-containing protein n=1 Tax=Acorus calamus TaxID=4465 RepID=A0AAV9DX82_ACOCL|nr:hypothetical protein QJS10_CPA10g01852 [Acorus calamus]
MDASIPSSIFAIQTPKYPLKRTTISTSNPNLSPTFGHRRDVGARHRPLRIHAIDGLDQSSVEPAQAEVTWQIIVGAIAGITPFVVAGIEFGKRIVAQRRCEVCGGSGLVQRKEFYIRCPGCGGFLPWKSWKRFFSG